jgi:hypothetical protein
MYYFIALYYWIIYTWFFLDVDGKLEVDDVAKLFDRPASRPQPKMRVESVIESRFGGPNGVWIY